MLSIFTVVFLGLCVKGLGVLHYRSYFYVGQSYDTQNGSTVARGAMYVEHLVPAKVTQPFPLVFIHGLGMTGTNLLETIDGEPSWADYFLGEGYELYLVDVPNRGRSAWHQGIDGPQLTLDTVYIESRFTATERYNIWPQAALHTQWPGTGSVGDPIFDNFYAATVPSLASDPESSEKIKVAGSALLDQIGPAIIMVHSQSGPYGWILADARPTLVKAVVALEPQGPPFMNAVFLPLTAARPYGIAETPLQYSPPIESPDELVRDLVYHDTAVNVFCYRQASPARQLVNLIDIPILMVTSESGYHASYDNCTADYLVQAGVTVDHISLPGIGIHGNGHMMFMERNRLQIARDVVQKWLLKTFRDDV
ncbi:Alpha/beta hydrolase family-domain-containing protein [Armillaria borealis]|uniref:Alpha/beta hydrolase family-domain-containing protein n=1 Tax=Armillaria borealis TaxID=47425 RepID=A0AA39K4M5_9AGAR|nr:Alpha/beta hydrolase family-domain-containing protein [Armillaria borealis]